MQMLELHPDTLIRASLLNGQARAFLLESTNLVERARSIHSLSRTAAAALGRTLSMTAILGAMLKGENESVTVRIEGDGPAGMIMAIGKPNGCVKGFVSHPALDVPRRGEKLDVGALVGHSGTLTVIKDLRLREPYIGQVPLVSGEIGEDFAMYFTSSEQTPSMVSVGVLVADRVVSAGALVIQLMPGADENAIKAIEDKASSFMDISRSLAEHHIDGTLERLLSDLDCVELDRIPVMYRCDCSDEKVRKMLMMLGENELNDMINTQHGAEVDCHFCNTRRRLSENDLKELVNEIQKRRNEADEA